VSPRGPRAAVIGLDGTPAGYLRSRIAGGGLPNLGGLAASGTLMDARAPLPPISSVSWASASTGTNPGRHGVFGFVERKRDSWELEFTNVHTIAEPAVWALAAAAGLRSVVVNVPGTYPAQPLDGVLISGFVSPSLARSVQPPELVPWLEQRGYLIDVDLALGRTDLDAFWEQLVTHHQARERVLLDLLERESCDLFFAAFTGTDRLHHFMWEQMERGQEPWASRFHAYYDLVDRSVAALVDRLPAECTLALLSDHGFCRLDEEVYVNRWLERDGWLQLQQPARSIASVVPAGTRAYCMDPGRLYLNLEGREPGGIVSATAYREVRDELQAWAEGLPFVTEVVPREQAFTGPFADRGPDLVLVSRDGSDLKGAMANPALTGKGPLTGMHTRDNAFVLVRDRHPEGVADVQDVAATVLEALGLDPGGMDGRVLDPKF
jgi:predicted AlkP superfamily phosphohydrolase/phosphomutase